MTYNFAMQEAQRRSRVMTRDYAIVYSELGREYMVIPLFDARKRDLLIVDTVTIDTPTALQHEEILAGLGKEISHSRFVNANGQRIQWTYDGKGGMVTPGTHIAKRAANHLYNRYLNGTGWDGQADSQAVDILDSRF